MWKPADSVSFTKNFTRGDNMAYLLKDHALDALKLPENWSSNPEKIAREILKLDDRTPVAAEILSASVDSRRGTPRIILSMRVESDKLAQTPVEEFLEYQPRMPDIPENTALKNPLVIGTGPAGIFGAYILALAGCRPVIIDRGQPVSERVSAYEKFLKTRELDTASNLLIGEGGAGTFSDGKLYTGTKDFRAAWVKRILVDCGAPEEIIWQKRAHVGSDNLAVTAENLRKKIIELGGTFLFNTEVADLITENSRCTGVVTAAGERITAPAVLFAPGLGGRELVRKILDKVDWSLKPFQTGCRIEHPQHLIDRAMYHTSRPASLGAAEYHLVSRRYPRHTATFCMCPGGEVVNATAWEKRSISNGMSLFARAEEFANSCLICTFNPGELGGITGIDEFFRKTESACFLAGGGDYTLPAQDAAAFLRGENGLKNSRTPSKCGIVPGRIDNIVPKELFNALASAVREFDRRIPGFIRNGKFIGVESCVSSPVRILRDRETMECSLAGLYCAGEGCGLAGGIISAACDGIRCAGEMIKKGAERKI